MRPPASIALLALALAACIEPARPPPGRDAGFEPCDPFADASCPEGEACQPVEGSQFGCSTAGTRGDQEPCSAAAPCAAGFACAIPPGSVGAVCLALCRSDADCPQAGGHELCVLTLGGATPLLCQRMRPCEPFTSPVSCQPGEKCSLLRVPGQFVCVAAGERGDYQACTRETDCAPGSACVEYTPGTRVCARFCTRDSACPQSGGLELCLRQNQPDRAPVLCERVRSCTPGAAACPAGEACFPFRSQDPLMGSVEGLCRTPGDRVLGQPCSALNQCGAGLTCFSAGAGDSAACRVVCALAASAPPRCPTGTSCLPITPNFGACR